MKIKKTIREKLIIALNKELTQEKANQILSSLIDNAINGSTKHQALLIRYLKIFPKQPENPVDIIHPDILKRAKEFLKQKDEIKI